MIRFACPKCRTVLSIRTEEGEKLFKCPRCQSLVRAPKSAAGLAPVEFAEEAVLPITTTPPPIQREISPAASSRELCQLDLSPEWSSEAKQTNLRLFMVAVLVVGSLAIALSVALVVASREGTDQKNKAPVIARFRPPQTISPPPSERSRDTEADLEVRRPPLPDRPSSLAPAHIEPERKPAPAASVMITEREPELPAITEPPTPIPGKLLKEIVPGYETRQIQGF